MFIYVVKAGDSIFSIASKYEVTMDSIRIKNGLKSDLIVPGQDLLIPTNMYTVQPGDSLFTLSNMCFTSIKTLRLINGLNSDILMIGKKLYLPPRIKYETENLSYVLPTTRENNQKTVQSFAPTHTYFGIFEYHILEDGNLSPLDDKRLIQQSRKSKVAPLAVITNLTDSGFSPELTKQILTNPELREQVIENICTLVKRENYAGVNIDFERVREEERDLYSGFLRKLRERLKPSGYITSAAVPAKTSDDIPWLNGYDFGGIGSAVDFVFIMAYDWHDTTSPPGPISPIIEVRKSIEYAIRHMRTDKIILGIPSYAYDWTLSEGMVESVRAYPIATAIENAMKYQVPIQFSTEYAQPFFHYGDEAGKKHIVWYEDSRALAKQLQLVVNYRLKGIGSWQLGLPFPQSTALMNAFLISKD